MHRLVSFIVIFALFLAFIVFNLGAENRSNVSIIFYEFKDIPIFLTVFFSFVLGMFFSIPLFLLKSRKKPKEEVKNKKINYKNIKKSSDSSYSGSVKYIGDEKTSQIKKEPSSYGID